MFFFGLSKGHEINMDIYSFEEVVKDKKQIDNFYVDDQLGIVKVIVVKTIHMKGQLKIESMKYNCQESIALFHW